MSEIEEEWNALPYGVQQTPIATGIPYNYRWRISMIKLMLNDLQYLNKTHKIQSTTRLYNAILKGAEELFQELATRIEKAQNMRAKLKEEN